MTTTTAGTIFFPVSGGAGTSLGGGIFAQPNNIGTYGSHQLAGVAELGVRTGYRVTEALTPYIAYNALYVSSIIRPGDAMSPYINTTATALAAASRAFRLRELGWRSSARPSMPAAPASGSRT